LAANIVEALGLSAVLTHMNRSNLTLKQLGEKCVDKGHYWAYNWITLNLVFIGYTEITELIFCRDGGFKTSWIESNSKKNSIKIFMASGNLNDWWRFTNYSDNKSFSIDARLVITDTKNLLAEII
jgi:hypothetical protein